MQAFVNLYFSPLVGVVINELQMLQVATSWNLF